ncbi:MAG: alpha-L-fucosidase [Oscillospiraceae bacterium]|nr:alpha-L-fucosidase [Oscillospiraceae bacterium]
MPFVFSKEDYERRTAWYTQARFGMFIHWGLYAIPARGEWVRSTERIPSGEYGQLMQEFHPKHCDMGAWMDAAKAAGMKYVVMTAKHHDGFCLFDSAYTDFKSTNSPAGRDFVREFLEAARSRGLRAGLYFSLLDWRHPDYPHYGDLHHPMRDDPAYGNEGRDFNRYLDYLHNQVRELCTNYGKLDLLWFDFSYGELRGEAWRGTALMEMVRSLQPDVIVDNRLEVSGEGFGSLAECRPTPYHGDFVSPEQIIPPNGLRDTEGKPLVWESCVTMNNHWGYCAGDNYFKPAPMLVKKLVECVSKGGNLLLNVGPDAQGRIPGESLRILQGIGQWMECNGESVYGCGPSGTDKPDYGRVTRRGDTFYFHIFDNTIGAIPLMGLRHEDVLSIRRLADGSEVPVNRNWIYNNYPEIVFADLGPDPVLPDPVDMVLEVRVRPGAVAEWR